MPALGPDGGFDTKPVRGLVTPTIRAACRRNATGVEASVRTRRTRIETPIMGRAALRRREDAAPHWAVVGQGKKPAPAASWHGCSGP